jgi:hypothetical protein
MWGMHGLKVSKQLAMTTMNIHHGKLQTLMIMALGNAGKAEFPAELCAPAKRKRDMPTDVYTICPETHSFNANGTFLVAKE